MCTLVEQTEPDRQTATNQQREKDDEKAKVTDIETAMKTEAETEKETDKETEVETETKETKTEATQAK